MKIRMCPNAIIRDMLYQEVLCALEGRCLVEKGGKILLGFSGGSDSVCLLDVLYQAGYSIVIAYFDHQLRPESRKEVEFARQVAAQYKIDLVFGAADISHLASAGREGIESTARKYRYRFLAEKAAERDATVIAVAHHADDQVETILMNIIRGSGLNGLTGMAYRTDHEHTGDMPVIRPLLDVWKCDILTYCEENGLEYMTDDTNYQSDYTRNKIRNEIIPALLAINPNVKANVQRMRSILMEENAIISKLAQLSYKEIVVRDEIDLVEINVSAFNQLSIGLQRRLIMNVLSRSFSIEKDMRFQLVEDIRSLFIDGTRSLKIQPGNTLSAMVEGNSGYIFRDISRLSSFDEVALSSSHDMIVLEIPSVAQINSYWEIQVELIDISAWKSDNTQKEGQLVVYLDADRIDGHLSIRRKQPGDRYAPLGMDGHMMKVSDFWINKKIPQRLRGNWPLVCDRKKILWIPGFQPAHPVRITASTRAVLKLSIAKKM